MSPNLKAIKQMFGKAVAPNGLPVHENFAKWFNVSKVVDASGKPLTVYHATNRQFDAFDHQHTGVNFAAGKGAFFFTDDHAFAEQLAHHAVETTDDETPGNPTIMRVYLSLHNPRIVDLKGAKVNVAKEIRCAKKNGNDGLILIDAQDGMPAWPASQYIAFEPSQIKSANNTGDFDPTSFSLTDAPYRAIEQNKPTPVVRERMRA